MTLRRLNTLTFAVVLLTALLAISAAAQLVLDDSLQGSTSGTRSGGSFVSGGWQVTGDWDYIFWHVSPISNGAAEFYVTGLHDSWSHKTEHFHMYDWTYGNADYVYNGGYRDCPYKHFIRKSGIDYKNNQLELLWQILPYYTEPDTAALSWSTGTNYCFRVEWFPEGGNSRFKVYRDGIQLYTEAIPGAWNPGGQSIRIAASNRHAGEDAEIGAKYSYVKVWNMAGAIPAAPTVSAPANGATIKGPLAFIKWTGDSHDRYHVHVCATNDPEATVVWDSGEVMSSRDWVWTGNLSNMGNYYIYIKLGNANGWSAWSAAGRWFHTDNTYVGSNNVQVLGQSMCDANGPMLGLGFTYMTAMYQCKNNPSLFNSDLAFMSARGYNYARILSMVGWYSAWIGKEIAPVTFQARDGYWVNAWPDYWTQFRNCIDTMYDTYGIRTELTIFADAQLMPGSSARQAHLDSILSNLVGREHKIMHLEVANEYWQNGFPDPGGMEEVRYWGQYLTDRTSIPVALSAPCSDYTDSTPLLNMYTGSTADITTEHLTRTIGTQEGGWLPVRDSARLASFYPTLAPGSSNEPIGPGSSVAQETDVTRLVSAAAFAYVAGLPLYVYHTDAGVFHNTNFQDKQGVSNYQYLDDILPPDVASWVYNDGLQSTAPFTVYCNGVPNQYWTSNYSATSACHRNIGGRKGIEFVCYPQGVRSGGVILEARQQLTFKVWDPLTGNLVMDTTTKETGQQITLSGSLGAYIIKGAYGPTLPGGTGLATLTSRGSATITVDGNSSDWSLGQFTTLVRGGQTATGDTALVGWDGGSCYYGSYSGVLPTSASDHTAKVYSRNDSSYLYLLARCDDNDMRYSAGSSANWQNDCVEIYIDPSHDHGATAISNSTSDIQLVIDANNQKNVYCTTSGYATQVLGGVTSAVVRDGTGWWLEARITKSVLDPDIPAAGNTIGLDFMFRDNDNNNDAGLTTLYTWNDGSYQGFPSKIPSNWGDCFLDATQTPYSGVINLPGTVQAENYDVGGNNISYYDTSSGNSGGQYRSDDVDIEACSDTGGGYNVGWAATGEWLEYTVNVASTGDYSIVARVASGGSGGSFKVLMDGADVTGTKSLAGTGGWQNWTSIIAPSCYLTAGQHVMRFVWNSGDFNLNKIEVISRGADAVSIDLGNPDLEDGMNHISSGDGHTEPWTVGGHNARANLASDDNYMYFNVTEAYCYQGSKPDLYITYDYYDIGTGSMALHYDSITNIWATQAGPTLTNSLTWKTYTFHVTDAYFGNRQNYGADFRIAGPGGGAEFEIDTVCVYQVACTPPTAPTSASANPATICSGASSTLTATGGSGENCRWYTGSCGGTLVGTGTSINVSPTSTTTYYVRWETATCGNSTCQTTTVTVNPLPTAPTSASASPSTICSGASTTLTATGGSGTTLRWMTGSCGGTSVGTGNNLVVSPTSTTTYYVRWENSCGNSTCQTTTVTVNSLPTAPTSASASPTTICSGASSTLTATGGSGTTLRWMTGSCGGTSVGTGNNLVVSPTSTTTYYVRWENSCGNSTCVTTTVTVNPLPVAPTSASANPSSICSQSSSTLTATGGSGTTCRWFTGSCGGTSIGTGTSIVVTPGVTTTYYVRWENSCGNSTCATTTLTVGAGAVTGFTATPGNGQVGLSWTNPTCGTFTGTKILFKTTGYPTGPADGTQVYDSSGTSTNHTGLTNGVTYYYSAYAHDAVPNYASAAQASAQPVGVLTINTKSSANLNLVIDANSTDWNIASTFTTKARGGMGEQGDYAIVGFDGGTCYYGSYVGVLPTSATDHTGKVYSYHDHQYQFFLVRCDDNDMQYGNPTSMNWANDCIEFYIDPSHDHGDTTMNNSTSDCQLVIDANNQKNVYMTTSGYATQVLNGVTSAVVRDGTGWWLEAKVSKTALDPDVPNSGSYGVDFNFRDNDNNNDAGLTTVYAWRESSTSGYPSKIPSHWGDASLATLAADTTPPAAVTGFTATAGSLQVSLSWTNPATADWAGTQIRFKTTGYPTGPADGTQIYNGTGASYPHTGLTAGVTYYYGAYAYDEVPNYATAAQASATPTTGTVTLNNSTFDSGSDGWTLTVWRAATQYGYGTFAWGSTYGRTGGGILNTGTGSSDNTDRCTREGGEAQKTISTVGYSNIKVYYDLDVNTLGLDRTGTGSGACAVDHNLIDEQITVYYSTNGGSSWTEAEYLLRSALLASYQSWGTRMIDLTGVPAVNNNANFRLRFRWQCNSGADLQALDNIVVTSN